MKKERKRLLFWHLFGIGAFNIADYILTLDFLEKGFMSIPVKIVPPVR
ncbi:MAG: hypothetical protein NUK57_08735 [Gudongella sp.]|nr:hypothetical protein [Gudongella sp.]